MLVLVLVGQVLVLVLVLGVRSLSLSLSWFLGGQVLVLVLVLGSQVLVNIPDFYSASSSPLLLRLSEALPIQHGYCDEFHAEAPQATASEGLAKGPYVAARAGFEPTTLRSKGVDSTNAPLRPTIRTYLLLLGY